MEMDMKIAVTGLLISLVLLLVTFRLNFGIGLATTFVVSCLVYIFINRKTTCKRQPLPPKSVQKRPSYFYFSIVTGMMIVFLLWCVSCFRYERPLTYFVIAAVLSAIIALEIGLLRPNSGKIGLYQVLTQILLLAAALRFSTLFAFPGFIAVDPWVHAYGVQYILETGHVYGFLGAQSWIPSYTLDLYSLRAVMHILISAVQMTTSLPGIKDAFTVSVGIPEVISVLFVFILAKKVLRDEKKAALASLFVAISSWNIMWGFMMIPMTLGLTFFTLLLFLMPIQERSTDRMYGSPLRMSVLFLLVFTALVFTHTIAALIAVLCLFFVCIGEFPLTHQAREQSDRKSYSLLILLFATTIILMINWVSTGFIETEIPFIIDSISLRPLTPTLRSLAHFEIDNLGTYGLYFLAILGGLHWLRWPSREKKSILLASIGLSIIVYGTVFLGITALLPERWMAFLFVLLAPIAAYGYHHLLGVSPSKIRKAVLLLLVFFLTFSMLTSNNSNVDTPIYYRQGFGDRKALKESEIAAVSAVASFSNRTLYTDINDTILEATLRWSLHQDVLGIDFRNFDSDAFSGQGLIVMRREVYFTPSIMPSTLDKTNHVYSSGTVEIFIRRGG